LYQTAALFFRVGTGGRGTLVPFYETTTHHISEDRNLQGGYSFSKYCIFIFAVAIAVVCHADRRTQYLVRKEIFERKGL
jgi:hypothetical protein